MDGAQSEPTSDTAAASEGAAPQTVSVRVEWEEPAPPILLGNALFGVLDDMGDIIMHVGQILPPAFPDDPEEREAVVADLKNDPVIKGRLLLRFSVSPRRVRQMINSLEEIMVIREKWLRATQSRQEDNQ